MPDAQLPKSSDVREAVFVVLATTAGLRSWTRDEMDELTDRLVAAASSTQHDQGGN